MHPLPSTLPIHQSSKMVSSSRIMIRNLSRTPLRSRSASTSSSNKLHQFHLDQLPMMSERAQPVKKSKVQRERRQVQIIQPLNPVSNITTLRNLSLTKQLLSLLQSLLLKSLSTPERRQLFQLKGLNPTLKTNLQTHTSPIDKEVPLNWMLFQSIENHQLISSLDQLTRTTRTSIPLKREEEVSLLNLTERTSVRSICLMPRLQLPRKLNPSNQKLAEDRVY